MDDDLRMADFNETGDDVSKMTKAQMYKLTRYKKFEKQFPWYQMDVNGYIRRIKECMAKEEPENSHALYLVGHISIETMAEIFKVHPSWSDLSVPESKLYKFIMSEMLMDKCSHDDVNPKLSIRKLRAIGTLWCDGDPIEKTVELYENF